jgi:hypothetical protein
MGGPAFASGASPTAAGEAHGRGAGFFLPAPAGAALGFLAGASVGARG